MWRCAGWRPVGLAWGAFLCWRSVRLAQQRLERHGPEIFARVAPGELKAAGYYEFLSRAPTGLRFQIGNERLDSGRHGGTFWERGRKDVSLVYSAEPSVTPAGGAHRVTWSAAWV